MDHVILDTGVLLKTAHTHFEDIVLRAFIVLAAMGGVHHLRGCELSIGVVAVRPLYGHELEIDLTMKTLPI